jgi:hypothetical protein
MSRGNAAQAARAINPDRSCRGSGEGMHAIGEQTQHGKPRRWRRVPSNQQTARLQAGPYRGDGEARSSDEAG